MASVFLSYAREDLPIVWEIYHRLKALGIQPWMDTENLRGGEVWETAIETAIEQCELFVACLSSHSVSKRGVIQQELKTALSLWRRKLPDDVYVIPVRVDDCNVPRSLSLFHWVDLFEDRGWHRLLDAITNGLQRAGVFHRLQLREKAQALSPADVDTLLKKLDVLSYDAIHKDHNPYTPWNPGGNEMSSTLELVGDGQVMLDKTTGLCWLRGNVRNVDFPDANRLIHSLCEQPAESWKGWRLPTLEEALSLIRKRPFPPSDNLPRLPVLLVDGPVATWTCDSVDCHEDLVWIVSYHANATGPTVAEVEEGGGYCGVYPVCVFSSENYVHIDLYVPPGRFDPFRDYR
jgi:hypothetical protein